MPSENKKHTSLHDSYRIIDANLNRSKEGLRVCEEISRFHLKNAGITKKLKNIRHRLTSIIKVSDIDTLMLFKQRDSVQDIGRDFSQQLTTKNLKGIFMANSQRAKEALRVLEEFLKLLDVDASRKIQKLRFDFYTLEKDAIEQFPALLDS